MVIVNNGSFSVNMSFIIRKGEVIAVKIAKCGIGWKNVFC